MAAAQDPMSLLTSNQAATGSGQIEILFDVSKKELGNPHSVYKKLVRKLRSDYKCGLNKDLITLERLKTCGLVIFAGPREMFSTEEFEAIKKYIGPDHKGSVLFLLAEGGEQRLQTNVNYLLEEFGIMCNSDSVIRTTFRKYHHPKEAFVCNGVLSKDLLRIAKGAAKELMDTIQADGGGGGAGAKGAVSRSAVDDAPQHGAKSPLEFVYPFGATMNVQKPAVPVLSTGPISYPLNRPVCAVHENANGGRLCVLGSWNIFSDDYLDKENNAKVCELLIKWLTRMNDCDLSYKYGEEPDISEYHFLPHTQLLAESLKSCLQEGNVIPRDFTEMFDDRLFKFDTSLIPEAIRLYQTLGVKHEALTLIPPEFETPLPQLRPAVFPPVLKEPPGPPLDLYDLDEEFASEKTRLAQLTNKCTDEDLDYYVMQAGEILQVSEKLPDRSAKHVLEHVFSQILNFKKLNQGHMMQDPDNSGMLMGPPPGSGGGPGGFP
ncbi:unnamed protein product [Amoebophrya sp. A120]|nr:unnamed protein product [Amoebophrya sp. A120]|eukprot:GSA120T00005889001.1